MRKYPLLLAALVASMTACHTEESIPYYGNNEASSDGITLHGSSRVKPPNWREPNDDGPRSVPIGDRHPILPREKLAALRVHLSDDELLALLGDPAHKEVLVQSVDHDSADWNARVWSWRFQDDGVGDHILDRVLAVRLAKVTRREVVLGQAPVNEPGWIVTGWDLE